MSKQRNALKAGIFIIIAIALTFLVAVMTQKGASLFEKMQHRTVAFTLKDDIGGLRRGDDVRIGGFKVGVVRSIELSLKQAPAGQTLPATQPAGGQILVTFSLPRRYSLYTDAMVSIQGTVTGQSWLNFESLGGAGAELGDEPLKGTPSTMTVVMATLRDAAPKIDRTLSNVEAITADVRKDTVPLVNDALAKGKETAETFTQTGRKFQGTADEATALVKDLRGYVKPVIEKYNAVADGVVSVTTHLSDMFGSSKGDYKQTVANLRSATGTIAEKLPEWGKRIDEVLENLNGALVDTRSAVKDIKQVMATANDLVTGNKGKFEGMIKHLHGAANNMELFTAEISARPWRVMYKPDPKEVENLVIFDATREFAAGASELSDAARVLRDAAGSPQADPEKIEKAKERLNKAFEGFGAVEQKLWEQVRKK